MYTARYYHEFLIIHPPLYIPEPVGLNELGFRESYRYHKVLEEGLRPAECYLIKECGCVSKPLRSHYRMTPRRHILQS